MKNFQVLSTFLSLKVKITYLSIYLRKLLDGIRNNAVLNIVANEAIVFSTKERAPYYICVEIFRPEE